MTDGQRVFIGKELHLQSEIDEALAKTRSRSCFKECRSCGSCANSKRDSLAKAIVYKDGSWVADPHSYSEYDYSEGKYIDCRECEPFRFHDCHNGVMRNARGEAEPFTDEQYKLLDETGGKPLI